MKGGPIQRVVRLLLVLVSLIALGLIAGIVVVYLENAETNRRLTVLEEYIQGKGEQRDRENAQLEESIRQAMCDLLDQLPEGGLLNRPRSKYHCGPGIPLSQLTPEEQAQISRTPLPPSTPEPQPTVPPPPMGSPATPDVERPPVAPVPPRTGPGPGGPEDPAAPPQPLRPVTDLVCDLAGVCLEESP